MVPVQIYPIQFNISSVYPARESAGLYRASLLRQDLHFKNKKYIWYIWYMYIGIAYDFEYNKICHTVVLRMEFITKQYHSAKNHCN